MEEPGLPTSIWRFPRRTVEHTVLGQGVAVWRFVPVATVRRVAGGGDTAGGRREMAGGLKGSDHKEQEQSVFVAVCAASIRAITDTRELISNGKT